MQKRVVLVAAAVAVIGAAAVVLGFFAEGAKSKAFAGRVGQRCLYRRTAALTYGVAAALLALAGVALATAASGCFGRYRGGYAPSTGRRRATTVARLAGIAWVVVVVAAALFLYGAALNRGGTRGLVTTRSWRYGSYYSGCAVLKNGIFATASIIAAGATACAIAAYVFFQQEDETVVVTVPAQFATQGGVAMGQPQWSQPYPPAYPPPMGYPAPPAYGGYGAKQPAGPA